MMPRGPGMLLCALLALWCGRAHAQTDEDARKALFAQGSAAAVEGRWRDALEHFEAARAIRETSGTVFNLAIAQMELGLDAAAIETFEHYLAMPTTQDRTDKRELARESIEALRARAPAASGVPVAGPPSAPGDADAPIEAPTTAPAPATTATATPAPTTTATATPAPTTPTQQPAAAPMSTPEPAPTERPRSRTDAPVQAPWSVAAPVDDAEDAPVPVLTWVLLGSGAALLVGSIVTGAVAVGALDDLEEQCVQNRCAPELRDTRDQADTFATITDVLWISGAVAAGAGITVWMLDRDGPGERSTRVEVAPGGIAIGGAF